MTDAEKIKAFALNMRKASVCSNDDYQKLCDMVIEMAEALEFYKEHADCKTVLFKCACKFCANEQKYRGVFTKLAEGLK